VLTRLHFALLGYDEIEAAYYSYYLSRRNSNGFKHKFDASRVLSKVKYDTFLNLSRGLIKKEEEELWR
jgi:hypothetical protein